MLCINVFLYKLCSCLVYSCLWFRYFIFYYFYVFNEDVIIRYSLRTHGPLPPTLPLLPPFALATMFLECRMTGVVRREVYDTLILDITKTCLYNFDPLKPHFYIVKLGFTGVCTIFLISAQNIDCGYSLEPPRRGGSNEYPQSMFWAEIWKISVFFFSENVQFLVVKFAIYLNGRVFVMMNHSEDRSFGSLV